jgi:hypothetical protein
LGFAKAFCGVFEASHGRADPVGFFSLVLVTIGGLSEEGAHGGPGRRGGGRLDKALEPTSKGQEAGGSTRTAMDLTRLSENLQVQVSHFSF